MMTNSGTIYSNLRDVILRRLSGEARLLIVYVFFLTKKKHKFKWKKERTALFIHTHFQLKKE